MMHLRTSVRSGMSYITSSSDSSTIERSARAPVLRSSASSAAASSAPGVKTSSTLSSCRNFWNWRVTAFLGSVRTRTRSSAVSADSVTMTGSRPTNSGISPNLSRSSGISCSRILPRSCAVDLRLRAEADRPLADPLLDDLLEALERAAADEQDVGRVDLDEVLVGVLAAALRRHVGDRPLEDLQQRLLDALARDVAGDRGVVRLARDLVDLVDVDDPALGPGDVEVGRLDEPQEDVLDVLADVAGLGQRRRVGDAERARRGPAPASGPGASCREPVGPDEQDVRLLELDLVDRVAGVDPLVVVVDGDREDLLGPLLADDVLVERGLDLARVRELRGCAAWPRRLEHLLFDDLLAEVDALVADVDALARDQLADLLLALATEAAAIRDLGSLGLPGRRHRARPVLARPSPGSFLERGAPGCVGAARSLGGDLPPARPRSWAWVISESPVAA